MKEKAKTKWLGKTNCDICGKDVRTYKFFFDSKTKMGTWMLMCWPCYNLLGIGKLGIGLGQKYDSFTFEKV